MILDTEFLGSLVEQQPNARAKARELDDRDSILRVPAMVVWEVFYGIENAPDPERELLETAYNRLFETKPVVELTDELARQAGRLRGRHARSDSLPTLDGADSAVAATALAYNEPVVSNDTDFDGVDGLTVETY